MRGTRVPSPRPWARILLGLTAAAFSVSTTACEEAGNNNDTLGLLVGSLGVADVQVATIEGQSIAVVLEATSQSVSNVGFAIATSPAHGNLATMRQMDGLHSEVEYTPTDGFIGQDTFTFDVLNGDEVVKTATAVVLVYPEVRFEAEIVSESDTLQVEARAYSPSGYDLPQGTYRWSLDGAFESGSVATHSTLQRDFSLSGKHVISLTLVLAVLGPIECSFGPDGNTKDYTFERTSGDDRANLGTLVVTPTSPFSVSGPAGGPFSPGSSTYQLTNTGTTSIMWTASNSESWLSVSPDIGSLEPGAVTNVVASINGTANGLSAGNYADTIEFRNITYSDGNTDVAVWLDIDNPVTGLVVTPSAGLHGSGHTGGPFTPPDVTYILSNPGPQTLAWSASNSEAWLTLSATSGTLASGANTTVVAAFGPSANALSPGTYNDTIAFVNETNGVGNTTRESSLVVAPLSAAMDVDPVWGLNGSGTAGGPFTPNEITYTVTNLGDVPMDWETVHTQGWVSITPDSGTLAAGASTDVLVVFNANAGGLAGGVFNDTVMFDNNTNGIGSTSRGVLLNVNPNPGSLQVTPGVGFNPSGTQGGPFSPNSIEYTLRNHGGVAINWSVEHNESWLTLSSSSGTLAPSASTTVTVTVNANANSLPAGSHSDSLEFINETNGDGNESRGVLLTVNSEPGALHIDPAAGMISSGPEGGPFDPSNRSFILTNNGGQPIDWSADSDRNWVTVFPTSGTLIAGGSTLVTAAFNANANALPPDVYTATLSFTNETNGDGSDTRGVLLTVEGAPGLLNVTPSGGLTSAGPPGGPFSPVSTTYTLENAGDEAIAWSADSGKNWVQISPSAGTLNPGDTVSVIVQINGNAASLPTGVYDDTVGFYNDTNDNGDTTRSVQLTVTPEPAALSVTPAADYTPSGPQGGPFSPGSRSYAVTNTGGQSMLWGVTSTQNWVSVTPTSGALSPGAAINVTASINSNADSFSPGTYNGMLRFINLSNGDGNVDLDVELTVEALPGVLSVTPSAGLNSSGPEGGPFSPTFKDYVLQNTGGTAIGWSASSAQNWLTLSSTSGALNPGQSVTVRATINNNANGLPAGNHSSTLSFTNTTNGTGNASRTATLTVTATGDDPEAMTTASRTSGIAPLAVFFDAVDEPGSAWNSNIVQPSDGDYAKFTYMWDFGDGGSGTWSPTGLNRNTATGFVAAHVYDNSGTYVARLTVIDDLGNEHLYEQTINVQAFSGTTYYFATDGNDSSPGTQAQPKQTWGHALSLAGPNVRLLFKRGQTWNTSGLFRVASDGPGIIGAWGSGTKPIIHITSDDSAILLDTPDWRVMDIDFRGPGSSSSLPALSFKLGAINCLAYRCETSDFRMGMDSGAPEVQTKNKIFVVDCDITGNVYGYYGNGRRLAIMGTDIHDVGGSHLCRIPQGIKVVISNNRLSNPGPTRQALKFHSPDHSLGMPESEYACISDNRVAGTVYAVTIAPQNAQKDERIAHVLYERNHHTNTYAVDVDLYIFAQDVTVRNNIFDGTNSTEHNYYAVYVVENGIAPPPSNIKIYHNTAYKPDSNDRQFALCYINSSGASNVTVRGNLACAPNVGTAYMILGTCPGLVNQDNRLTNTPGFVNAAAGDFRLQSNSEARDQAASTPYVRFDFGRVVRPAAGLDQGAWESWP